MNTGCSHAVIVFLEAGDPSPASRTARPRAYAPGRAARFGTHRRPHPRGGSTCARARASSAVSGSWAFGGTTDPRSTIASASRPPSNARLCATRPPVPCATNAVRSIPRSRRRPRVAAACTLDPPSSKPLRSATRTRNRVASSGTSCRKACPPNGNPGTTTTGSPSPVTSNGSSFTTPAPGRPRRRP